MHEKLRSVVAMVSRWCGLRDVSYDIACDENDLQGLLLFKRDMAHAPELLRYLQPTLESEGVHARAQRVRSGVVLAFSLRALSESELAKLTGENTVKSDFADKISSVFDGTSVTPKPAPKPVDIGKALFASARELHETAFEYPTKAHSRNRGHARRHTPFAADKPKAPVNEPSPLRKRRPRPEQNEVELPRAEGLARRIDAVLHELDQSGGAPPTPGGAEGLQGMGAEHQPADLFQRFNAALQELGAQTSGIPLQKDLEKMGIKWKKSDDGQALIFFVKNGDTGAPQPIARVGAQTIAKPQEFQKALSQMLDFSKGQAPGTEEQKQQEVQDVQKRLREIATNMAPQDPEKQAAVMKAVAPPGVAPPAPPAAEPGPGAAGPAKPAAPAKPKPQNPKVSNLAAQAKKPASGGSLGQIGPRPQAAGRGPK